MTILPLGDSALLVRLGVASNSDTPAGVRSAFDALLAAAVPGFIDVVPAYTDLAVHYDPLAFAQGVGSPHDNAADAVRRVLAAGALRASADPRTVEIRVEYGGAAGPDLDHVARHAGLTIDEVIRLHTSALYTVVMVGFVPGFPYLAGLPQEIATPRRSSPRLSVPAGSVGIAGAQTGVYPLETPGGWQIIGRTDMQLFRPDLDPPTVLRIGDQVRFSRAGNP